MIEEASRTKSKVAKLGCCFLRGIVISTFG